MEQRKASGTQTCCSIFIACACSSRELVIAPAAFFVQMSYFEDRDGACKVYIIFFGKGGMVNLPTGRFHTPSWIKVHDKATLDDIIVAGIPFKELFDEPKTWKFKSASSDKEYTVREGKNGLHCDCWGYIAHRKCKHLKEVSEL